MALRNTALSISSLSGPMESAFHPIVARLIDPTVLEGLDRAA
jgi:hypothetical protein